MQIHSLGLDVFEEEYSLIGIHTTLEDYKLAYLLNEKLGIKLSKSREDLEFEEISSQASFSIFDYVDKEYDYEYFLIANSAKIETHIKPNELLLSSELKTYLISEKKKVDFFIKISGSFNNNFTLQIVKKIKEINTIITSYSIDKNSLKSKDFLTF
jgi:hypothetical protein